MRTAGAWLTAGGLVVGLLGGFVTAVWEVFLTPVYAGAIPVPVAPVLAVLSNVALIWFTRQVTGRTGLALLPGVVWFGVMLVATVRTTEGDLLIPGNDYMGLATVLVGSLTWALLAYRLIVTSAAGGSRVPGGNAAGGSRSSGGGAARKGSGTAGRRARKPATGPRPQRR